MGYKIVGFCNESKYSGIEPTVKINNTDPNWESYYENWKKGKNPTDSKEWKHVVAITEEIK